MANDNPQRSPRKKVEMKIKGLGIPTLKRTPLGLPSVDEGVLELLAGEPNKEKFGKAYEHFKQQGK